MTGASSHNDVLVSELADRVGCDLERGAVSPTPPTPVSVTSGRGADQTANISSSRSRPTKEVTCRGRFPGEVSTERNGGNSCVRPIGHSCVTRSGREQTGEAMFAQIAELERRFDVPALPSPWDITTWPPCVIINRAARLTALP